MSGVVAEIGLRDGLGVDDVFWFVCGLAATATALGVLLRPLIQRVRAFATWWEKFARDWDGEDADAGRDRVPGVMERLNAIDGELKRNGGSSLKDQVCQANVTVEAIVRQVSGIESRQLQIAAALEQHSVTLDNHVAGPGRIGYDSGRETL